MAAAAQRLILGAADRVAVGRDASPVGGGVAQPVVGSQTAHDEQALARTPGDRRHPAETAKRVVVPPPQRVVTLGQQRSEDAGADAEQREQDGRVGRQWGRRWRGLGGRVRVFRRCGLGELVHQSVELAARVTELPVDQHEAFGEEPHMRGGGLGGARRDLDDRRPQPLTQRRGIDVLMTGPPKGLRIIVAGGCVLFDDTAGLGRSRSTPAV